MTVDDVRSAYGARAGEYIERFGTIDAAAEEDRALVLAWATQLEGRVLDLGCGPGHWTGWLHGHGLDVVGADPVPEFVELARQRHPGVEFQLAHVESLEIESASLGGVLAWFSLIHTPPAQLDALLQRIAGWIRPGGGLLVGCFEGPELVAFDHAVATAWFWPLDELAARIERAGFEAIDLQARQDPGVRRQGSIVARRRTVDG